MISFSQNMTGCLRRLYFKLSKSLMGSQATCTTISRDRSISAENLSKNDIRVGRVREIALRLCGVKHAHGVCPSRAGLCHEWSLGTACIEIEEVCIQIAHPRTSFRYRPGVTPSFWRKTSVMWLCEAKPQA